MVSLPPGKRFRPIDWAWRGMSGRVGASPAGEKSSVLISPSTLKTLRTSLSGKAGRDRNHSPAAHESRTDLAWGFDAASFWTGSNWP